MIRVGILLPDVNTTVEPEIYKMAPEGVTVHFSRITFESPPPSLPEEQSVKIERSLDDMGKNTPIAARAFRAINPKLKVIAFSCNSGSFYRGIEYEEKLIRDIEDATGIPGISASGAMIQAFKELGLKKLCVISPYTDYQNERAREFLVANGFEVVAFKGLGALVQVHGEQGPEVARELAITVCQGVNCDGVYSCCTNFRTIEILEEVEKEIGKPMVSANQATMWLILKKVGVREPISGFGTLLRHM